MHTLCMVPLLTVVEGFTLLFPCDSLIADLTVSWAELKISDSSYQQQGYVEKGMNFPSVCAWIY